MLESAIAFMVLIGLLMASIAYRTDRKHNRKMLHTEDVEISHLWESLKTKDILPGWNELFADTTISKVEEAWELANPEKAKEIRELDAKLNPEPKAMVVPKGVTYSNVETSNKHVHKASSAPVRVKKSRYMDELEDQVTNLTQIVDTQNELHKALQSKLRAERSRADKYEDKYIQVKDLLDTKHSIRARGEQFVITLSKKHYSEREVQLFVQEFVMHLARNAELPKPYVSVQSFKVATGTKLHATEQLPSREELIAQYKKQRLGNLDSVVMNPSLVAELRVREALAHEKYGTT
jgi:DNA mismatch repair ATPase MutS